MKTLFNKLTAVAASAVLTVCSVGTFSTIGADTADEPAVYTVTFDLSDESITIAPDEDDNIPEINDITAKANSSVFMPEAILEKENYTFSCWSPDGIRAYEPGDVFRVTDSDVVMKPMFTYNYAEELRAINYYVEINGEVVDTSKTIPNTKALEGGAFKPSLSVVSREDAKQFGWTDGTNIFLAEQKFVVPDHDVTLTPNWMYYYNLTYYAGDVDRLKNDPYNTVSKIETTYTNLSDNATFIRKGFTLKGWHCELDGLDYSPAASYLVPSQDVTFTAIWEPVSYVVVFKAGTGNTKDNIKVPGKTDETITVPEMTATRDGYTFVGWKYNDVMYYPGDDFFIEGELPGIGIGLDPVWEKGSAITTTTTTGDTPKDYLHGDANLDGEVNMADAVLIMQALSNPDKYDENGTAENHITKQGKVFADVYDPGSGMTSKDALSIQKFLLKIIDSLPEFAD